MDFLKNIKNNQKKLLAFFDRDKESIVITARRDWSFLIIGFSIIFFIFVVIALYSFAKVSVYDLPNISIEDLQLPPMITKGQLEEVIVRYDARKEVFDALWENRPIIVDPSQ